MYNVKHVYVVILCEGMLKHLSSYHVSIYFILCLANYAVFDTFTHIFLASCPIKGQVFENCTSCQGTCDNPVVSCPVACTGGGCVCPPGQLVDTEANECVHPSQCPVKCSVSYDLFEKVFITE